MFVLKSNTILENPVTPIKFSYKSTKHETFTNYFTPEHGGQIVPDVDGALLAELTHA